MSSYEPKYLYGQEASATASATITGGQLLVVSGNGTVGPAGAGAANVIGVAAQDAASGARLSYFPRGKIHITTAAGSITAGDQVISAASGQVATLAAAAAAAVGDVNAARQVLGVALTTAANGVNVEWMEF
jgi:deoxyinosine 3'endonuclease (endonuclease V)